MTEPTHQERSDCSRGLAESGGRVCNLDFRPSRFFGCRVEEVLAEFFCVEDVRLRSMTAAFRDLSQGTIRPGLDDRVLVEAAFSPTRARGSATLTLFYRLPCIETQLTDKVLRILDRRSTSSGYYRLGRDGAASVRGSTRVRTSVVGNDDGESYLVTTIVLRADALVASETKSAGKGGEEELTSCANETASARPEPA